MKTKFGVNSVTPINKKLKNGYIMYDWVMRIKGFPAFCMRTLCGECKITEEEINFLRKNDCKIGLVIRDLTEIIVSGVNGVDMAMKAVQNAKELRVPDNKGIALFAEIKPEWRVNHNWILSFGQTLLTHGYIPGFIINSDQFVQASNTPVPFGAIFMPNELKIDSISEECIPYCLSALEPTDIHLWCCGTTTFDFIRVDDLYVKDDKVFEIMW